MSFFLSYMMFYPSLVISRTFGAIDLPGKRKIHTVPTARAGGFSFFAAFSIVLIVLPIDINLKIPLLLSGVLIFLVGFLDNTTSITPFVKLAGQFLAFTVYLFTSELLGYDLSAAKGILSAIWIIFTTNATNLIDGLDGLAGGICTCEALCLAAVALIFGNKDVLICALLIFWSVLGFLPRNFPRARIFMGDCGALFLGFTLSVLSSRLVIENNSIVCAISILLIFRVPTYDTNISIVRRLFRRQNPFKADKEHFHHHLISHGFSKECATLLLITVSLIFGFLGILLSII